MNLLKRLKLATQKPICSVLGCGKISKSLGLCQKHYLRQYKTGSVELLRNPPGAGREWIQAHVGYTGDDCLIFPFWPVRSAMAVDTISITTERYMCLLAHGDPPTDDRYETAHSCGNGHLNCLNPKHLRWATSTENKADMQKHGTVQRGNRAAYSALTEDDVQVIRQLLRNSTHAEIAEMYGVHRATITAISNEISWSWMK